MRNHALLVLASLLMILGCRKEVTVPAGKDSGSEIVRKEFQTKKVATIDGAVAVSGCTQEVLSSGEIYQICKPAHWNGDLILYAHGYVSPFAPVLAPPSEAEAYLPLFLSLGYAVATSSFSEKGLAVVSGIQSMVALRQRFEQLYGRPATTYLTGGSEGGIITTLAVERYPELFSGGLSLCGPCGSFQNQVNYFGDFRVLFDYFFPGVLPGTAINIPDDLITNWYSVYVPKVKQAITAYPSKTLKLLNTAKAAYVSGDNSTVERTVLDVLWYNVFATRDAHIKLGGQPFDNSGKVYYGSGSLWSDYVLNRSVQRYTADYTAKETIRNNYETSGKLSRPLVSSHTTKDQVIPFWHLARYTAKAIDRGSLDNFIAVPVDRYGHCNFTEAEVASTFALLVLRVKGAALLRAEKLVTLSQHTGGKIVQSVHTE
jgi:pimeloyl-ACP methyl ester carboxylesterase